jgi:hypothetical protein
LYLQREPFVTLEVQEGSEGAREDGAAVLSGQSTGNRRRPGWDMRPGPAGDGTN